MPPIGGQRHRGAILLAVRGMTKYYREVAALAGVEFDLRCGEILGVIGPNGAGKATLLECLAGLQGADSGEVNEPRELSANPRSDTPSRFRL
jgi:branched-chain amino acid transport system ATP-binding protein